MKVRDIQKYLEGRCPSSSISLLGTDKEPFLETIYGQDQELDSTIRDVASFAKDSEEQLFYEFVQNAFDANADSLCFFFDKDYLIVLNNGDPFYTDPREEDKRPRDGQLYNFLAKGKSIKAGDEKKSGEYGQGSKLLYTLISDKSAASNKTALINAIKNERKGPYLVSWRNVDQLNNFRFQPTEGWNYTDPHAEQTDLLVCKILMTYYPIAPGVDKNLFSMKEFHDIRKAFENLVDPKRNINRLKKGTAIIIPLGKGQYEAIAAEDNLKKVMVRLGGFASLTSDKERNFGRHLEHIYVAGREVEMHPVKSRFVEFSLDGDDFTFQFAFNPVFAKENYVTLFKTLPVLGARYRMGFIIDSQNFELDSSRQRINDTQKTGIQLEKAFSLLLEDIKGIQSSDKELFDYIYDSLMASWPGKKDVDVQFISKPFYDTFSPFIRDNVRTADGAYRPMQFVRKPDESAIGLPLEALGIKGLSWISEDIKAGKIDRFDIDVQLLSLKDILLQADDEKLSSWIKTLGKEQYGKLHGEFLRLSKFDDQIGQKPIFLSNKGEVYSFNDLLSAKNHVILYDEQFGHSQLDRCPDIEYILGPVTSRNNDATSNLGTINVSKIAEHIDFYRENDARIDAACQILADSLRFPRTETAIRNKIELFRGLDGNFKPLKDLIKDKPEGTTLFDPFCVAGYVPSVLSDDLFISGAQGIWSWTVEHFEDIKSLPDWADCHNAYLRDLISVYKAADSPSERLSLYLNESGIPTEEKAFCLSSDDKLTGEQYERVSMFAETQGYNLVPNSFKKILSSAPFKTDSVSIEEILEDGASVDSVLLGCIVKLAGANILWKFVVKSAGDDRYDITKLPHGGRNYTCKIESESLDAALSTIGFNRIDPAVSRYFSNDISRYELTTDNSLMDTAIDRMSSERLPALLPVVSRHNDAINEKFFDKLPDIVVDEKLSEDDIAWKLIQYGIKKSESADNDFYRDRLLELISHKGQRLPDTIKSTIVQLNGTDYDLYKLLGDVKTENELADSFFECLPDSASFRTAIYADNQETKSAEEVYKEVREYYLSVEQLRFCLDYSLSNHPDYTSLELEEEASLAEALDMISEYGFAGFDKYFQIDGFDKDVQVYAQKDLLLEEEYLPESIQTWIEKDPAKAFTLISGLNTESSPYIAIRSALKKEEPFYDVTNVVEDTDKLARTVEWIVKQGYKIPLQYSDNRFSTLNSLLDKLPENIESLPGLKFTGSFKKESDQVLYQFLSFEYIEDEAALMTFQNVYDNASQIESKLKLKQFFKENLIYGYDSANINFLMKQGLNDRSRYMIKTTAEEKKYEEWATKAYNSWKTSDDSEGVKIFLSKDPIGIILSVSDEVSGEHVLDIKSRSDLYGSDSDKKTVVIQHPNPEGLSEMKTLERAARATDFFKNPFIALQGIYVEMVEQGVDPNELDDTEKKGVEMANKLGDEAMNKLAENIDTVKDIIEGLTEEELKIVAENKDKIRNLLEDMPVEDESMESKVRKNIGYIGELIYEQYLKNAKIKYDYAAARGVGDYDFSLDAVDSRPKTYVDVKTNLYSFKEEAVPFYIHKSQNRFMQEHPEEPFRIVRISLTDLDLNKSYERMRDLYGPETDYEASEELREYCQKIARDYWRKARIEEFDAASPEYGIKIERLPR